MYPHERRLVKKYANRPFVVLGVNQDDEKTLKQLLTNQTVTWRCWWDGNMHLFKEWQLKGWPTQFLVDHQGVIRLELHWHGEELETAIKALVEAAEKGP
jgi:hypothetical protein